MELLQKLDMPHRRRLEGLISLGLALLVLRYMLDVPLLTAASGAVLLLGLASVTVSTLLSAGWWGLTGLIGKGVTGLMLTVAFCLIVTPVGLLRRLLGKGPASLRPNPPRGGPALELREHDFGRDDFHRPW